ncbi:MAG: stage II sporulation protein M [Candidatus Gracilibacteria bacterium]
MLYLLSGSQLEKNGQNIFGYFLLFLRGIIATVIAYIASHCLFRNGVLTVTLFLTVIQLYDLLHYLLDKNHESIQTRTLAAFKANIRLVLEFFSVFLGILLTLVAAFVLFSEATAYLQSESLFIPFRELITSNHAFFSFPDFITILINNFKLFLIFFLFSLVFRLGVIFVLAVNATIWASIIATITVNGDFLQLRLLKALLIISPHMILEVCAYIVCALAGIFLSRALSKYHLLTLNFFKPAETSLVLLLSGLGLLIIGSFIEAVIAPVVQTMIL